MGAEQLLTFVLQSGDTELGTLGCPGGLFVVGRQFGDHSGPDQLGRDRTRLILGDIITSR